MAKINTDDFICKANRLEDNTEVRGYLFVGKNNKYSDLLDCKYYILKTCYGGWGNVYPMAERVEVNPDTIAIIRSEEFGKPSKLGSEKFQKMVRSLRYKAKTLRDNKTVKGFFYSHNEWYSSKKEYFIYYLVYKDDEVFYSKSKINLETLEKIYK